MKPLSEISDLKKTTKSKNRRPKTEDPRPKTQDQTKDQTHQ